MSIRLHELEEFSYEQLKKKIFPLILRRDLDIKTEGDEEFTMDEPDFYINMNLQSELEDLLIYDLGANTLSDIVNQMDFDIKEMFHVGNENLIFTGGSIVLLLVDKSGEFFLFHQNYEEREVDVYLLSDSDKIIKFIDEFIQLLTRLKKNKKKVFDYLKMED